VVKRSFLPKKARRKYLDVVADRLPWDLCGTAATRSGGGAFTNWPPFINDLVIAGCRAEKPLPFVNGRVCSGENIITSLRSNGVG
jgi:hypothetical protein